MKVVVAHPGTQHSFRLAQEIEDMGHLEKFISSFVLSDGSYTSGLARKAFKNRIIKRVHPNHLKGYPFLEIMSQLRARIGVEAEDLLYKRNRSFQKKVVANDLDLADVVIGFDTSSWILAEYCQSRGIRFILDVSIGHPVSKEKVFEGLRKQFPRWGDITKAKKPSLISLELREFELAQQIVVPSSFVKQTLLDNGVDPDKISVIPFGTDVAGFSSCVRGPQLGPVKFLFFGSLTARKGLPLLLEAWKNVKPSEATLSVAGYGTIPAGVTLPEGVTIRGPVAQHEKRELFEQADVFIFPSYFEGLAQVQLEAAASGLPIIGTFNSGAAELVKDYHNGFVIPPGNTDELISSISYFIKHQELIRPMGEKSRQVMEGFTWTHYRTRWQNLLEQSKR